MVNAVKLALPVGSVPAVNVNSLAKAVYPTVLVNALISKPIMQTVVLVVKLAPPVKCVWAVHVGFLAKMVLLTVTVSV